MGFFHSTGQLDLEGASLRCLGGVSAPVVNALYPMEALTRWHAASHIAGATSRWMDTGTTAVGGAVRGSFHRLLHGHHLVEDGVRVLVHPELKFGHFLHHLGLDALTARGIPNPLIPTVLTKKLLDLGLSQKLVAELVSVNVPKILGGSLGIITAGKDILMMFSDAIPHTFLASGLHFTSGVLQTCLGCFPPNLLLLAGGFGELLTGAVTCYRAVVDPVLPLVGLPGSVFFPALQQAVGISALVAACAEFFHSGTATKAATAALCSGTAAAVSTTVSLAFVSKLGYVASFLGPGAGLATYFLLRKLLNAGGHTKTGQSNGTYRHGSVGAGNGARFASGADFFASHDNSFSVNSRRERRASFVWNPMPDKDSFASGRVFPLRAIPEEPLGRLQGDKILLNGQAIRRVAQLWAESGSRRHRKGRRGGQ